MKKILFVGLLLLFTKGFSQEWGTVKKNVVTTREIAPIWPGCEGKKGKSADECFRQQLGKHVGTHFKYPVEAYKNNEQGRVIVEFNINEKGEVDILSVTDGTKSLQEEAKRIINAIPKMKRPGMLAGKPRALKYTVPITFKTGK